MTQLMEVDGIYFKVAYSNPRSRKCKKKPCRALVTPKDPITGKNITKRQLTGIDSDNPVAKTLYGKNEKDIQDNLFPSAAKLLIGKMRDRGLIAEQQERLPEKNNDLADCAAEFKETFFQLHDKEWAHSTAEEYRQQYDYLMEDMRGFSIETLTQDAYADLQKKIFITAAQNARKQASRQFGNKASSSGQKRLSLLYLLLWDLKSVAGYNIPIKPTRYGGTESRQDMLLDRIDGARSLPYAVLQQLVHAPGLRSQTAILADGGLRISENAGLLWESLHTIEGSQGPMYYLSITGQIDKAGKRTEIPKSDAAYRIVPISIELGQQLAQEREQLSKKYGDIALQLMSGKEDNGAYIADKAQANVYRDQMSTAIPVLLQQPKIRDSLIGNRPYTFDKKCQDKHLRQRMTCHALRRNFCTALYEESGLDTPEIYNQMGHAMKDGTKQISSGSMPPQEIYQMCLKKQVSRTLFHPAHPLRYQADQAKETETPACAIEITLPPGAELELCIEDTEPGNSIELTNDTIERRVFREEKQRNTPVSYALLAKEEVYQIKGESHPFAASSPDARELASE